jgi:hypothetical protein
MTWFSHRSRADRDWHEAIAPELRGIEPPEPSPELWSKIEASRAAGARNILPHVDVGGRSTSVRRWAIAAAVTTVSIGALGLWIRQQTARRSDADALQVVSELFSANVAFAESRAVGPGAPPLDFSRAATMRPRRLVYRRTWRRGKTVDSVTGVLRITAAEQGGTPAWLFVTTDSGVRDGRPTHQVDTLVLRRTDLRLLRHTAMVEPYLRYDHIMIRQQYTGDSVLGHMNAFGADATGAGRPIARRLESTWAPYIDDQAAPILLSATRLHERWTASASLMGWAVRDGDVFYPFEMRVVGSDRIHVPSGSFDCWRITIRLSGQQVTMWARKSDGLGIRVLETRPGLVRENILISEDIP